MWRTQSLTCLCKAMQAQGISVSKCSPPTRFKLHTRTHTYTQAHAQVCLCSSPRFRALQCQDECGIGPRVLPTAPVSRHPGLRPLSAPSPSCPCGPDLLQTLCAPYAWAPAGEHAAHLYSRSEMWRSSRSRCMRIRSLERYSSSSRCARSCATPHPPARACADTHEHLECLR